MTKHTRTWVAAGVGALLILSAGTSVADQPRARDITKGLQTIQDVDIPSMPPFELEEFIAAPERNARVQQWNRRLGYHGPVPEVPKPPKILAQPQDRVRQHILDPVATPVNPAIVQTPDASHTLPAYDPDDMNRDGTVDVSDIVVAAQEYGDVEHARRIGRRLFGSDGLPDPGLQPVDGDPARVATSQVMATGPSLADPALATHGTDLPTLALDAAGIEPNIAPDPWDVNGDGQLNIADVAYAAHHLRDPELAQAIGNFLFQGGPGPYEGYVAKVGNGVLHANPNMAKGLMQQVQQDARILEGADLPALALDAAGVEPNTAPDPWDHDGDGQVNITDAIRYAQQGNEELARQILAWLFEGGPGPNEGLEIQIRNGVQRANANMANGALQQLAAGGQVQMLNPVAQPPVVFDPAGVPDFQVPDVAIPDPWDHDGDGQVNITDAIRYAQQGNEELARQILAWLFEGGPGPAGAPEIQVGNGVQHANAHMAQGLIAQLNGNIAQVPAPDPRVLAAAQHQAPPRWIVGEDSVTFFWANGIAFDFNQDGAVDISDAIEALNVLNSLGAAYEGIREEMIRTVVLPLLNYLFNGGPPPLEQG